MRSLNWKSQLDFLFQSFLSKSFWLWLKKGALEEDSLLNWARASWTKLHNAYGYPRGPSPNYCHLKQANDQNSHFMDFWSLIILWVLSKLSLQIQFQFLDAVELQLGSVSITLEEWSILGTLIPSLPFWFRENVVEVSRQHKVSLGCDLFVCFGTVKFLEMDKDIASLYFWCWYCLGNI